MGEVGYQPPPARSAPKADSSHDNMNTFRQLVLKQQLCGGVARMAETGSSLDFLCSFSLSGSDKRSPGRSNAEEEGQEQGRRRVPGAKCG